MEKSTESNQEFLNSLNNLINKNIPIEVLKEIGKACSEILNKEDFKQITNNLIEKDLLPSVNSAKKTFEKVQEMGSASLDYLNKLKENNNRTQRRYPRNQKKNPDIL